MTIQSVLDVKDDNPAPKNSGPLFNRSILILTPERALKFTAANAERHYIWLTSLSFLAHSNQAIPDNLPITQPKPLPEQYEIPKPPKTRRPIRDSIRLTKSKNPILKSDPPKVPPVPVPLQFDSMPPSIPTYRPPPPMPEPYAFPTHTREISEDAAEPPAIARFHDRANPPQVHGRKRSNTGGHVAPPLSFRGFSGPASSHAATNSTAGNSVGTAGSSDIYSSGGVSSVLGSSGMTWGTGSVSRASEASSFPSAPPSNFFDAIGTVRMEAFISPLAFNNKFEEPTYDGADDYRRVARRRSRDLRRRRSRSQQRDIHSRSTRGTDDMDGGWWGRDQRDDPFKGF